MLRKSSGCPQRCLQTSSPWVLSLCRRRPSDSFLESLRAAGNDLSAGPLGSCHTERLTETEADFQIRSRGLGLDKYSHWRANWSARLCICSLVCLVMRSFIHSLILLGRLISANCVPDREGKVAGDSAPPSGTRSFQVGRPLGHGPL